MESAEYKVFVVEGRYQDQRKWWKIRHEATSARAIDEGHGVRFVYHHVRVRPVPSGDVVAEWFQGERTI